MTKETALDADFQKSVGADASSQTPKILKFERADWALFRTVEGLQRRAGVPAKLLRRLVLKELADNGLDIGAHVRVGELGDGMSAYFVEDDGPGIEGAPEDTTPPSSMNCFMRPATGRCVNWLPRSTAAPEARRAKSSLRPD
jgi:hypothetical protein